MTLPVPAAFVVDSSQLISALDRNTASIGEFGQRAAAAMRGGTEQAAKLEAATGKLSGAFGALRTAVAALAVKKALDFVGDAVAAADALAGLEASWRGIASANGIAENAIDRVDKALMGQLTRSQLLKAANTAVQLGAASSAEQLETLATASLKLGRAMGIDAAQAFDNLVTGVSRGSKLILDNLGIVIKGGASTEEIFAAIEAKARALPDVAESASTAFGRMRVTLDNIKTAAGAFIGQELATVFGRIGAAVEQLDLGRFAEALNFTSREGAGAERSMFDLAGALGILATGVFGGIRVFTALIETVKSVVQIVSNTGAVFVALARGDLLAAADASDAVIAGFKGIGSSIASAGRDIAEFFKVASPTAYFALTGDTSALTSETERLAKGVEEQRTQQELAAGAQQQSIAVIDAQTAALERNTTATVENARAQSLLAAAQAAGGFSGIEEDFGPGQGLIVGGRPVSGAGVVDARRRSAFTRPIGTGVVVESLIVNSTASAEQTASAVVDRMERATRRRLAIGTPGVTPRPLR